MSLNSPEIDLILSELPLEGSHVQKVIQPNFKNLYLSIYSPPTAWWLRIALEHPRVRIHRTQNPPKAKRSHQRFEDFLSSRIVGGRIESVEHVNHDRIVRIDFRRDDGRTSMYVRLWGTRANVIVTEESGTILDVCFRKPKEELESGKVFVPPSPRHAPPSPRSAESKFVVRPRRTEVSFNDQIDQEYDEIERRREIDRIRGRLETLLTRRRRRLATRLTEIEHGMANVDAGDRNRHFGDLILASIHLIPTGAEWVDAPDYLNENAPVRIQLDPRLDAAQNAQKYYDRARRADESAEFLASSSQSLSAQIAVIDEQLAELPNLDLSDLRSLLRDTERDQKQRGSRETESVGVEFASQGFQIIVGRNARENDALLRGRVRGNDWWLHTRDFPGGYVFIRNKPGKSVPLEVLLDAGNLALFYSKGRANGKADLYYTQVKFLRRAKDGPRGLVLPTQEKNLYVELDPQRLQRLGITSSI